MLKAEIRELKENIAKHINEFVEDTESAVEDRSHQISRKIAALKEPYLREILIATQTNNSLDKSYTASDILTILENLDDFLNNLDA